MACGRGREGGDLCQKSGTNKLSHIRSALALFEILCVFINAKLQMKQKRISGFYIYLSL